MLKPIPLGSKILVNRHPKKTHTSSGLLIEGTEGSITCSGDVIACGIEVMEVMEGDIVLFNHTAGNVVEYQNEKYFLLREAEVLQILREYADN